MTQAALEAMALEMARQREESARDLERANKELEAFSYSVSHDLRAPLRAIEGFSVILIEDYAAQLDDEARQYLERVRRGAQQMSLLIDDLLALSRISRAPFNREQVDVTDLARKIIAKLQEKNAERAVELRIDAGLTANADPEMLRTILEHLLGNAWKFSSKRSDARIDVSREDRDGEEVLLVRDNGAGFNMSHAGKLFAPFQRLHAPEEFPGRGIGLATIQRITSRHGGRAWAEGALDQGATVFFTLGETAPAAGDATPA